MGDHGNTPLMHAAAEGDASVMTLLLKYGANPALLNNASENALGFAVTYNHVTAIAVLASAGADINNTDDSGPNRTQLDIAELSDWPEVAAALRRLGAKRYSELNVSSSSA